MFGCWGISFPSGRQYRTDFIRALFASKKDRGHTVVTNGPYRYIRHPGYFGGLLAGLATPIMLGSLWALVAGVLLALLLVNRTSLEDKVLHNEPVEYAEYAQQRKYRLVPGIW